MRLLVGLGNPGPRYAPTRHNLGFMAVERVARAAGASFGWRGESLIAEAVLEGEPLLLAKPQTFMNLSGPAVAALRHSGETGAVDCSRILVYLDDLALPLGALRLRERGSAGGHKGLVSLLTALGTEEVPRMRLGIAPEGELGDPVRFVLGPFTCDEREAVEEMLERAMAATRMYLKDGIAKAMSLFNRGRGGPTSPGSSSGRLAP